MTKSNLLTDYSTLWCISVIVKTHHIMSLANVFQPLEVSFCEVTIFRFYVINQHEICSAWW